MKSTGIAYLLWLISGFGVAGLHRFYLGKIPTGILWMCTGGLGGLGALYDFFTLPRQVAQANAFAVTYNMPPEAYRTAERDQPTESTEQTILKIARNNGGVVTPSEAALETGLSLEKAKAELEKLVTSGFAELRVRDNGSIVYVFTDFASI